MHTVHSVTYGKPHLSHKVVTREVFDTRDGRILGTETTEERWYEGSWEGWKSRTEVTGTRQFRTLAEAQDWMDDMFRQHEIAGVKENGGTKLVFAR